MKLLHPVPGARISQYFGENPGLYGYGPEGHKGIDFGVVVGTEVRAAADGTVYANDTGAAGFGLYVRQAIAGATLYYGHLSRIVKTGTVVAGEVIALSGNTGNSTAPHLHFEVRIGKVSVDPLPLLVDTLEEPVTQKTSLHAQRILNWMDGALAAWGADGVKVVNPGGGDDPFPSVPHKDIRFWTDEWIKPYIARGEQGGREVVQRLEADVRRCMPWATAVQYDCEQDCNTNEGLANLCAYSIGLMKEADERGLPPVIILNLPEGNPHDNGLNDPEVSAWKLRQLTPAVKYASEHGHYIGRNIYWRPGVEGPLGRWHALGRLEWDVSVWVADGVDVDKLQVIVTECGIDGGVSDAAHPSLPQRGWRNLSSLNVYADEVGQFEARARQLPWLKRAYLFTAGYEEPWGGFNHTESDVKMIGNYMPQADEGLTAEQLAEAETLVIPMVPGHGLWDYITGKGWILASMEAPLGKWPAVQWGFDAVAGTRTLCGWSGETGVVELYTREN